jgi:hypothetical protein
MVPTPVMIKKFILPLILLLTLPTFGQKITGKVSISGKVGFGGSPGGGGAPAPSNFAYVAGSATGCYILVSATTCSYNLHVNPSAGNLGKVMVEWQSTTQTASFSCTNNTSSSWVAITPAKTGIGTNVGFSGEVFYIPSLAAGAGPETCALTISGAVNFMFWEYVEYSYSGTLTTTDGTPQYSNTAASGTTATISGLTTTGSSDLVLGDCIGVTSVCTAGTGYTGRNDTNACNGGTSGNCVGGGAGLNLNANIGALIEEKVNVAAGVQTATFGTGNADDMIMALVAF